MEAKTSQTEPDSLKENGLHFGIRVSIKALSLFVIFNLLFAVFYPPAAAKRVSAYNLLFPGRQRLPYGEIPEKSYNISLYDLEAMFASHELSNRNKPKDEYRIILIGDSSTWGFLLTPDQTLAAYLNREQISLPHNQKVKVYNLGYPTMSLTKDLLILSFAMQYQPDMILWPLTLESFPYDKQLFSPLLQNNPGKVRGLIKDYNLNLDLQDPKLKTPSFWDKTILGSRRNLADLFRFQLYGVLWAATGIDQFIPKDYEKRQEDLPADENFHELAPPKLNETDLAFEILSAGVSMARSSPVVFINEPIFISQGLNSRIRYNFFYPRWAFDDYRRLMMEKSSANRWYYWDFWDSVAPSEFTNTAIHLTPNGNQQFARLLAQVILSVASSTISNQ